MLRLRMPDEDVSFTDLVRGEVTFKGGLGPDYVIVRGNGQPLYTLVNLADDALMQDHACCAARTCCPRPRARWSCTALVKSIKNNLIKNNNK